MTDQQKHINRGECIVRYYAQVNDCDEQTGLQIALNDLIVFAIHHPNNLDIEAAWEKAWESVEVEVKIS